MMTLRQFSANMPTVPTATAWLIGDLGLALDWIRNILRKMKAAGEIRTFGHGAGARWERI